MGFLIGLRFRKEFIIIKPSKYFLLVKLDNLYVEYLSDFL